MTKFKSRRIKIGDKIRILAGDYKGLVGTVFSMNSKKKFVFIDTVPTRIKHLVSSKEPAHLGDHDTSSLDTDLKETLAIESEKPLELGDIKSVEATQRQETLKTSQPLTKKIQKPINISNIMLWDTKANRSDKIGYAWVKTKKVRFFKKSGNILDTKHTGEDFQVIIKPILKQEIKSSIENIRQSIVVPIGEPNAKSKDLNY